MDYGFKTAYFQQQILPPKTFDEAVARLCVILTDEEKNVVANTQEQNLIDLHFSLGLAIRNGFGLYQPDSPLFGDCGAMSADDASQLIIRQLWKVLNEK